jgi:hypothetical protein
MLDLVGGLHRGAAAVTEDGHPGGVAVCKKHAHVHQQPHNAQLDHSGTLLWLIRLQKHTAAAVHKQASRDGMGYAYGRHFESCKEAVPNHEPGHYHVGCTSRRYSPHQSTAPSPWQLQGRRWQLRAVSWKVEDGSAKLAVDFGAAVP